MRPKAWWSLGLGMLGFSLASACGVSPYGPEDRMDAGQAEALARPKLLSAMGPPGTGQQDRPVAILLHGYSASPYETSEAAAGLRAAGFLVSELALGGHQEGLEAFARSRWPDWQAPLIAEYQALLRLGYRPPALLGSSTGAALMIQAIASGQLEPPPTRLALVCPYLQANNPLLPYAGLLGLLGVAGSQVSQSGPSTGRWFKNRPVGTLQSLVDLGEVVKAALAAGVALPEGAKVLLIQSDEDPTVAPSSAQAYLSGLRAPVDFRWVASKAHLPIWPDGVAEGVEPAAHARLRAELIGAIVEALKP